MEELLSRNDALERGLRYFFTGKECRNGHISKRYVNNYVCQKCVRANTEGYRLALKHQTGAVFTRTYRQLHPDDAKALDLLVAALRAARSDAPVEPALPPVAPDPYYHFNLWRGPHGVEITKQMCKSYGHLYPE